MAEIPTVQPRRQLGRVSVWLAVVTFVVTTITIVAFYQIPQSAAVWNVALWIMMAIFFVAAPLAHLVGIVLGIAAIFKSDDRRSLGVTGALLNALFLSLGAGLVTIAAVGLGSFR